MTDSTSPDGGSRLEQLLGDLPSHLRGLVDTSDLWLESDEVVDECRRLSDQFACYVFPFNAVRESGDVALGIRLRDALIPSLLTEAQFDTLRELEHRCHPAAIEVVAFDRPLRLTAAAWAWKAPANEPGF